ncbi:NAD(P)/FAD-dependent oxidoreductase [Georgenia daeguensis]|uniref:NAD(P)/FAD-dependent oxidoreductase n=1 Tax=Georgenia daeguensis TaxID=908355 RepID=UPI0031EBA64E
MGIDAQRTSEGLGARLGFVVVGGGAAGTGAVGALRAQGYDGAITVVTAEHGPPYNRTTVSKGLLKGQFGVDAVVLPEAATPGVAWREADPAISLDPVARRLTLTGGAELGWDALIIATGAAPRTWAGPAGPAARERILTLHTAADARHLRALAGLTGSLARRVAVLGGGVIALEVAGVLHAAGAEVTVVSRTEASMSRHLGPAVGAWVAERHRRHVRYVTGATLAGATSTDGGLRLELTDGQVLDVDVAVLAHGTEPAVAWLAGSGLPATGGIAVDDRFRVRHTAGVYAAGDAARTLGPDGRRGPGGHWTLALEQGRHAARTALFDLGVTAAEPDPFDAQPTFTTDAYGTRLTVIGDPGAVTTETVLDGDPASDAFTVAGLDAGGAVVSAVGVGPALAALRLKETIRLRERLAMAAEQGS